MEHDLDILACALAYVRRLQIALHELNMARASVKVL